MEGVWPAQEAAQGLVEDKPAEMAEKIEETVDGHMQTKAVDDAQDAVAVGSASSAQQCEGTLRRALKCTRRALYSLTIVVFVFCLLEAPGRASDLAPGRRRSRTRRQKRRERRPG